MDAALMRFIELIANTRAYFTGKMIIPLRKDWSRQPYFVQIEDKHSLNLSCEFTEWLKYLEGIGTKNVYFHSEQFQKHWDIKCCYRHILVANTQTKQRSWIMEDAVFGQYRIVQNAEQIHDRTVSSKFNVMQLKKSVLDNLRYAQEIGDIRINQILADVYSSIEDSDNKDLKAMDILPGTYSSTAKALMKALILVGDLFGGMGNWDDGGVPTELTDELYKQFIQGVLYCVNAGDEPGFSLEG